MKLKKAMIKDAGTGETGSCVFYITSAEK